MIAIEAVALAEGRTLLTLDTWTGTARRTAVPSLGYVAAGVIPRYARGSLTPGARADDDHVQAPRALVRGLFRGGD